MLPPDPHDQYDQPNRPDEVEHTQDYPPPIPSSPLTPPGQIFFRPDDDTPLPLPYDDRDPTEQVAPAYQPPAYQPPAYQPPALPVPHPERVANGQIYAPAQSPQPPQPPQPYPPYQAPALPQQIIYVQQQRRPGFCSISCSILSILLLMTCGLVGLGIFRGVTNALETAGKTIPARLALGVFCGYEQDQDYSDAYQQLSSQVQQQMSLASFTQESQQLDQQYGNVTSCSRSNNSPDTTSANTVTILVDVTRGNSSSVSQGNIVMVLDGSSWRVNQLAASLNLVKEI